MTTRDWDPNEWQAYCLELMSVHYSIRVQLIPDRAQGDGGLEAFVADESIAFQCYAPESPFSLSLQTEAQKQKIRADTKKLIENPERTKELIGVGCQIREWVLLTPSYEDKALVTYANARAQKVSELAIDHDWCAPNFRISVHDDSLFAVARAALHGAHSRLLTSESEAVDLTELRAAGAVERSIEDTIDEKLRADPTIAQRPQLLESYKDETISDYFRGQSELARLARDFPSVYRAAYECSEVVFGGLARSIAESDDRPLIVVRGITDKLDAVLRSRLPNLGDGLIFILSRYFVASWWIQCPLQFEVAANA